MSTRSTIALLETDGTNASIYCHFDGYPEHVGAILLENYNSKTMVAALMNLGDISRLGALLVPPAGKSHSYIKPCEGVTVAYMRDRYEEDCQSVTFPSLNLLLSAFEDGGSEYLYIYHAGDACWYYAECSHPKSLHKLSRKRCGLKPEPKATKPQASHVFSDLKSTPNDNTQAITELAVQLIELRDTVNAALNNIGKTLLKLK